MNKLIKDDGSVVEDSSGIKMLITNFYKSLFESHAGSRYNELLDHVQPKVTPDMNNFLLKEYTVEEIKQNLDDIGDLKAPGADGMPTIFYKHFWHIVGHDVVSEVMSFLNGGAMRQDWNDTVVALIPKVANPDNVKDLRPISLCNVIYKIASKVLSNRLKVILPDIIALNQSAFVLRRLITDNVLLAYEMTHYIHTKRRGIDGYAVLG